MISGIVAILGAITGLVPAIMQWLTLKANNAHQQAMAELQLEAAKQGTALQIDLANAQADIKEAEYIHSFAAGTSGNRFVDALSVFVRPYITLVFFHFWLLIEAALFVYGVNNGYDLGQLSKLLWDENTSGIFGAIIGFWFGTRMMTRGSQMAATLAVTQKGKS
jgi:hypothetical protein